MEIPSVAVCNDGKDNDGDGLIDFPADPGCKDINDDSEKGNAFNCDDGKDNDGDGLIDLADPGCISVQDLNELNSGVACDNGIDDDGDGKVDMADPGCSSPLDNSEFGMTSNPGKFAPKLWMDDNSRKVYKSAMDGGGLSTRNSDYAFEGEQIRWTVLVMDKNGIEKVKDVYVSTGPVQGPGNERQANCRLGSVLAKNVDITRFNAKIGQEVLDYTTADNVFAIYECLFTVETQNSMHGEYWVTVEAEDLDGIIGSLARNEYWFFNPFVSVNILGDLNFGDLNPGHTLFSDTILLQSNVEDGSGVELNMSISGTDFYDSSSSGAKCPVTNKLRLAQFRYYATNGAFSTGTDARRDPQGYVGIVYGNTRSSSAVVIDNIGNVLNEGGEMSMTFKLDVPEPCNGNFNDGDLFFWFDVI